MTDSKSVLKAHAKEIKEALPNLALSHGQIIELVVSTLTKEESWNHFSVTNGPITIPKSLTSFFASIGRGQRRLAQLQNHIAKPGDRGELSMAIMDMLSVLITGNSDGMAALSQLLDSCNYPGRIQSMTIDENGNIVPLTKKHKPVMEMFDLGSWFFGSGNFTYGQYPWDKTKALALEKGFSPNQADLIRMLQREAPNHCWPLDLWFEVGILDEDQDSFLNELKADLEWEDHFRALYDNDGYY